VNDLSLHAPCRQVSPHRFIAGLLAAIGLTGLLLSRDRGTLAAEKSATRADAFVDTIGVGMHVSYTRTPYWGRWEEAKAALIALGVHHFRDGVTDCAMPASKAFCRHYAELGQAGLKGDFVTGLKIPMTVVAVFPAQIPGAFDSFEGPNEVDINGDPNWVADIAAYQQQLFSTIKGDPSTEKYSVIGPAIGHRENYSKTSDLSPYFDYGNLHNYLGPINPGTRQEGRIERWVESARTLNHTKPSVTTETGYWDGPPGKGLPDAIIARYEPRLFLEQFEAGIVRTFQYEFVDEGSQEGIYSHAGLVSSDLTPKPQYYALQSLISLLKDPGPAFTPGGLDYEVTGDTDHLDQLLFAKRDGSMYLALWLEKPSYDIRAQHEIAVTSQQVRLTIRRQFGGATAALTFDDDGHTSTRPLTFNGESAAVAVSDHLLIVRFAANP
jgi:hypothetical protein